MKEVEKLSFNYTIEDAAKADKDDAKSWAMQHMARSLAGFIAKNIDELPIKQEMWRNNEMSFDEHRISLYIISESELKRLKKTERLCLEEHGVEFLNGEFYPLE